MNKTTKYSFLVAGLAIILATGCKKDKVPPTAPSVTTAALTNITTTSATAGGTITNNGGAAVTASGIVLSRVHATPTLTDTVLTSTITTGSFTVNITSLEFNRTYYIRAYATNAIGTTYGDVVTLNTTNDDTKVRFTYNGQEVVYGVIVSPTTGKKWLDRNMGASRIAAYFSDAAAYGDYFQWGRLSDGHQVMTSDTTRILSNSDIPVNAKFILLVNNPSGDWRKPSNDLLWQGNSGINNPCPSGWHVPTQTEWESETSLIDSASAYNLFKLVGGGTRSPLDGTMQTVSTRGKYWSSTADPSSAFSANVWYLNIRPTDLVASGLTQRANGMSIRCIKN